MPISDDECFRSDILAKKIKEFIRRTTDTTEERLKRTVDVGLDEGLIWKVYIFAVDNNAHPLMHMTLEIDWERHLFHIEEEEKLIDIYNENWEEEIDFKLDKAIKLFNEYSRSEHLRTLWGVECSPNVDKKYARRKLGLQESQLLDSSDDTCGNGKAYSWTLGNFDEMNLSMKKYRKK